MLDLYKLAHFELFIPLPTSTFLALLKLTPCLRYFKTDYNILMVNFYSPKIEILSRMILIEKFEIFFF